MGGPKSLWCGRIDQSVADSGFDDLRARYNADDGPRPVQSQSSSQMDSAKHLFMIAARLGDASIALDDICAELSVPATSRTRIKQKSRLIKQHIVPMLGYASSTMIKTSTVLSPIGCMKYLHNRTEKERKASVVDVSNIFMNPGLQLIAHFVREEKAKEVAAKKRTVVTDDSPPSKRIRRATRSVSPSDESGYPLPTPEGGQEFSQSEVVNILSKTGHRTLERGQAIKAILAHQSQYPLISCSRKTINRLMERHSKGENITGSWRGVGRPAVCSNEVLREIALECETHQGKSIRFKDVKQLIEAKHTEKLETAGYKKIIQNDIANSTIRNYCTLLADQENIIVGPNSTVTKSTTRYAAENSIRRAISTLSIIAATHFWSMELAYTNLSVSVACMILYHDDNRGLLPSCRNFRTFALSNSSSGTILQLRQKQMYREALDSNQCLVYLEGRIR